MTDLRTAAQQALEALETIREADTAGATPKMVVEARKMYEPTITALRAALAEPVQEPVAWRTFDGEGGYDYWAYEDNENYHEEYVKRNGEKYASWVEPLYTAPPQRKPLTDEEILSLFRTAGSPVEFARAIEAKHGIL